MSLDAASSAIVRAMGLETAAQTFAALFPNLRYRVAGLETLPAGKQAETDFSNADGVPVIGLLWSLGASEQHRLFVHELAHVAAGLAAGHDDEWERAEQQIHLAIASAGLSSQ